MIQHILTIPKIKIAEANAFSSPFTVGFPAMTAWLGAVHALERKIQAKGFSEFKALGTGVISNQFELRALKSGYTTSLIGERHPLKKDGKSPSFVEEAKCRLTASLIIQFEGVDSAKYDEFYDLISLELKKMRMAGGIIEGFHKPQISTLDKSSENYFKEVKQVTAKLMPGYALIERRDLMLEAMNKGKDAMDAILESQAITYSCEQPTSDEEDQKVEWSKGKRKYEGWIVPIATGFQGLTEPTVALNQRDPDTPHRFAEALVTLGEFKMAYKFKSITDLLWEYHYDAENNLYTCKQSNK